MKICTGYGSERSTSIKIIGMFKNHDAKKVEDVLNQIISQADTDGATHMHLRNLEEHRFSEEMQRLLKNNSIYIKPEELTDFALSPRISCTNKKITIHASEENFSGLIRFLLQKGAEVKISGNPSC